MHPRTGEPPHDTVGPGAWATLDTGERDCYIEMARARTRGRAMCRSGPTRRHLLTMSTPRPPKNLGPAGRAAWHHAAGVLRELGEDPAHSNFCSMRSAGRSIGRPRRPRPGAPKAA